MQVASQIKTAAGFGGVATSLGKFLSEQLPKGFKGIQQASTALGANAIKKPLMTGALGGSALGAASGAIRAKPDERGQGAFHGAIMGAALGAGATWGASKLPTLGNKLISEFQPAGQKLMAVGKANPNIKFTELMDRGTRYMQKNFADQWAPMVTAKNYQALQSSGQIKNMNQIVQPKDKLKTLFGTGSTPEFVRQGPAHSMLAKGLAEMGNTWQGARLGGIKGIGKVLWNDVTDKTYFSGAIGSNTYRGKRSLVGRALNPLVASGVGMGVADAITATNSDGTKASIGKRVGKGAVSTVGWGLAPPVMAGKLVYDTSKQLIKSKRNNI